ncbi:MAG: 30S ribosomal protein S19e [Candidatus Marsarchaeota archaeon]|nr:30S ribosomal protein S19e [Candidatus Marsarchaeota archaeon]MCL5106301.1 30S ribosomal protein S19e [Candidatus Marsarchaeota archaeon]
MTYVYEVKAAELVKSTAGKLKKLIAKPEYVNYVKSGANKERMPDDPDFWFVRSASVLRQIYLNGPVGVSTLRTRYGSRKEHTMHRRHHAKAGGSIIRDILNELEKQDFVKKTAKGRVITPKGQSFLDKVSAEISKGSSNEQRVRQ